MTKPPKPRPCDSCPYRKDAPSGVWHEDEYLKLVQYDKPTFDQPPGVFMCHQQDEHLCGGWVGVHDMDEMLSMRIAYAGGSITVADADVIFAYESPVPLFKTGYEACVHGLRELANPSPEAITMMAKITRRHEVVRDAKNSHTSGDAEAVPD